MNKEYHKQYYQNHRKEKLESMKQYYKDNREEMLERNKKWRKNNPEKAKEYHRQYNNSVQNVYRSIIEQKIGRLLKDGEVVHHIDMDGTNNNPENLYLYSSKGEHTKGHWSLNHLIAELLRDGILGFKNGEYYLARKIY